MGFVRADQSISFQSMKEKMTRFMQEINADKDVDSVTGFTGGVVLTVDLCLFPSIPCQSVLIVPTK